MPTFLNRCDASCWLKWLILLERSIICILFMRTILLLTDWKGALYLQDISTKHLLYIQTATSNHLETKCVFLYHEYNLEFPITKAIPYYAKLHFTSASILIDAAKAYSTLTSWCLFTLIQNDSFPNKTKACTDTNIYQCTLYNWYDGNGQFDYAPFQKW